MLDLQEFLFNRGLPRDAKTKLVRHQDPRWDLQRLISLGQFDVYQEHQSKPVFDCAFVVSFIGQSYSHARLIGVYAVQGREGPGQFDLPKNFLYPDMPLGQFRYRLERATGYEDLERRVVIDWGGSTRSWHQWLKPKEIVEILPQGYVTEFPGYDDFILSFEQLREIIENPTANREWHRMLAAVAGIYLITDGTTGRQYVGSAYGAEGVLGRWAAYVASGHGGNLLLRELLAVNAEHAKHFSFTLLTAEDAAKDADQRRGLRLREPLQEQARLSRSWAERELRSLRSRARWHKTGDITSFRPSIWRSSPRG